MSDDRGPSAPGSPFAEPVPPAALEPGRIDVVRAVSEGWSAMLASFPLWLGVWLLLPLLLFASALTVVGIFLLVPVLVWGAVAVLLAMFDGRGELRALFSGFSSYGRALVTMWGLFVLGILVTVPGQAAATAGQLSGDPTAAALGGLLNLAWSLAMLPFSFAVYFAVDRGMGPLEAFRASWRATRSQWLAILLLVIAGVAIAALGLLALVVGIIPASAVIAFMWVSAYRQLTGPGRSDPSGT